MIQVGCDALVGDATARAGELQCLRDSINSLEVKEVDFEKEISKLLDNGMALQLDWKQCDITIKPDGMRKLAKHFFELGLKASLTKDGVNKICQLFMEREAIKRYFPDSIEWVYEQLNK